MSDLTSPAPTSTPVRSSWRRAAARWMVSFIGFPLGGVAAMVIFGPVDGPLAALGGGLLTGAVLGAVQVWGIGRGRPSAARWITATAIGLMVGLGVGAAVVDYHTGLAALVVQGAICGLTVGAAQAWVLVPSLGRAALAWPPALAAIWAAGWAITYAAGIQVDDQFTVFGSSGALVVTTLTAILPVALQRADKSAS